MRRSVAVVRDWDLSRTEGHTGVMNAASLVKQVIADVALAVIDDLDEPIGGDLTVRHVLSHTTGLPNWQWGLNDDASNFVIGCPATGDGVVVLTDDPDGRSFYRSVVERELPGDHPSLRVEHNAAWLGHFI